MRYNLIPLLLLPILTYASINTSLTAQYSAEDAAKYYVSLDNKQTKLDQKRKVNAELIEGYTKLLGQIGKKRQIYANTALDLELEAQIQNKLEKIKLEQKDLLTEALVCNKLQKQLLTKYPTLLSKITDTDLIIIKETQTTHSKLKIHD